MNMDQPSKTVRQQMADLLAQERLTSLELSQQLHISEKEVIRHLPHVAKTVSHRGKMNMEQPRCPKCGFKFKDRSRFSIPSRCPRCKNEHLSPPVFWVG